MVLDDPSSAPFEMRPLHKHTQIITALIHPTFQLEVRTTAQLIDLLVSDRDFILDLLIIQISQK